MAKSDKISKPPVERLENEEKKNYSEILLSLSTPKYRITACPVAFGETGVKGRIKSVLSYRNPALWIIIVSVIAVVCVAVGFMTSPARLFMILRMAQKNSKAMLCESRRTC